MAKTTSTPLDSSKGKIDTTFFRCLESLDRPAPPARLLLPVQLTIYQTDIDMLLSLISLLAGAQITWTSDTIGHKFLQNVRDEKPLKIRSLAHLVGALEQSVLRDSKQPFKWTDTAISRIERMPCQVGLAERVDGRDYRLLNWGGDDGLTLLFESTDDSARVFAFFLGRPNQYLHSVGEPRLVWEGTGKGCGKFRYAAVHFNGSFPILDDSVSLPSKAECKDDAVRKRIRARIEKQTRSKFGLPCDLFQLFPTGGECSGTATHSKEASGEDFL